MIATMPQETARPGEREDVEFDGVCADDAGDEFAALLNFTRRTGRKPIRLPCELRIASITIHRFVAPL